MRKLSTALAAIALLSLTLGASAQDPEEPKTLKPAPNRRADEGKGPFKTMVIRGGMLIDGTGAPPRGPVDIIIEGNRIKSVRTAGTPGLPLKAEREPKSDHRRRGGMAKLLPGVDGNGALYLNEKTGKEDWKGGVKYTIKDGIVYDAKQLLADVASMVEKQKQARAASK